MNSFLSQTPEVYQIVVLCIIALACGGVFGLLYSLFKKKDGYYKDMVIAYTLYPFLVTAAILGVTVLTASFSGSELSTRFGRVSVAVLSAILILRFRSEQRNFEDLTYMLALTVVSLLLGSGYLVFGLITYVVVLAVMALFYFLHFPKANPSNLLINITVPEDLNYPEAFDDIFRQYCDSYHLVRVKTADLGSVFILRYAIIMKKGVSQKEFMDAIRTRNSNLNISLELNEFKAYK